MVCPTCHSEPPITVVVRDPHIQNKIECVNPYLLGQPNQARRIRDVKGVLHKYIDVGVSLWAYLAFLLRILLLALNCTAIFYAFITYKSDRISEWKFEIPTRIVVWAEFVGICLAMLYMLWRFLVVLYKAVKELDSTADNLYKRNMEVCKAVREWYEALMLLDFNLLLCLRYISPPAVIAALGKARQRVYGKYGTRVHREDSCTDFFCCCCFYGRLALCTLLQGSVVVVLTGAALLAVLLKVLQLRFLGTVEIRNWSIPELLLFGQFVVNMVWMDTRQGDRRKAKLELLYHGSDAEESSEERVAQRMVDDLALVVLRYHYSLITALVVHHSITSEDISYIYIEDNTEADRPRHRVEHRYEHQQPANGAGGAPAAAPAVAVPPPPRAGRSTDWARTAASTHANTYGRTYAGMGPGAGGAAATAVDGGQVVVEMAQAQAPPRAQAHRGPAPVATAMGAGSGGDVGPSAPPLAPPSGQFPYPFYTQGRAAGVPVRQNVVPELKERYEQNLYCNPHRG